MDETLSTDIQQQWFVMRDLKRPNAKERAYQHLSNLGFEVFTPLTTRIKDIGGKRTRREEPFIADLLFVHTTKDRLDKIVATTQTLQYRFLRGKPFGTPMTVPDKEMYAFIAAVTTLPSTKYYTIDEITPAMYGKRVRLVCDGPLNGHEGTLLKIKGARKKRLILELPGLLALTAEISSLSYLTLT